MANHITTISLSDYDREMIERYNLSPTALIKEKILEIKHFQELTSNITSEFERKIKAWKEIAEDTRSFIDKKGLTTEFLSGSWNLKTDYS
jgi:hypothetical protein